MEYHSYGARKGDGCFPVSARMSGIVPIRGGVERRTTALILGQGTKDRNPIDGKSILSMSLPIQDRFSAAPSLSRSGRSEASKNILLVQFRRRAKISMETRLGEGCTKYHEDESQMKKVGRPKRCLVTFKKTVIYSRILVSRKGKVYDISNECIRHQVSMRIRSVVDSVLHDCNSGAGGSAASDFGIARSLRRMVMIRQIVYMYMNQNSFTSIPQRRLNHARILV